MSKRTMAFCVAMGFGALTGLVSFWLDNVLAAWVCGCAAGAVVAMLNVLTHPNVSIGGRP